MKAKYFNYANGYAILTYGTGGRCDDLQLASLDATHVLLRRRYNYFNNLHKHTTCNIYFYRLY